MSILQIKCEVWNRLSALAQIGLSEKYRIERGLPDFCKGIRTASDRLKPLCVPCKVRAVSK